jgi:hypothetical protein
LLTGTDERLAQRFVQTLEQSKTLQMNRRSKLKSLAHCLDQLELMFQQCSHFSAFTGFTGQRSSKRGKSPVDSTNVCGLDVCSH